MILTLSRLMLIIVVILYIVYSVNGKYLELADYISQLGKVIQ